MVVVSPPDAMWYLAGYRIHEESHIVYRFPVHLPQEHLYFQVGEAEQALERIQARETHGSNLTMMIPVLTNFYILTFLFIMSSVKKKESGQFGKEHLIRLSVECSVRDSEKLLFATFTPLYS